MPQVVKTNTNGKPTTTIVFDQKEEQKKREQHLKILSVSRTLRENGNENLYRTVQAILDPTSVKLFGLNPKTDTDKAVCEVFFPNMDISELTDEYCTRIMKMTAVSISKNGFTVLSSKLYRDPSDPEKVIGKILVRVS